MLMSKISLRFSLVFSILAMGIFGIILAIIIGDQYREFSVESQRKTFREIIRLQVNDVLDELEKHSNDLGKAVQSSPGFRKIYRAKDIEQLTLHLKSQFHQYFVTAGVYTVFGGRLPVNGSPVFQNYLYKELEGIYGGMWDMAEDHIEHAHKMIAHIDKKRKALGIDKARERVLMDMADRQKLEAA